MLLALSMTVAGGATLINKLMYYRPEYGDDLISCLVVDMGSPGVGATSRTESGVL